LFIREGDVLGAETPALLSGVPVELYGFGGSVPSQRENAEGLKECDGAGAIIIGTWRV
jgi:hypothetical protein